MISTERLNFIGNIALEYRLSLDSVCKLLKIPNDDETKMDLLNQMISSNFDLEYAYTYLFTYETIGEPREYQEKAYFSALTYLNNYIKALKTNDREKIKKLKEQLFKTDIDFKKLTNRDETKTITLEEATIISKYRVKYAISKDNICKMFKLGRQIITVRESQLESNILKYKIHELGQYKLSIARQKHGGKFNG